MKINIEICRQIEGLLPNYATSGSAAIDLRAAIESPVVLFPGDTAMIPTGLKMEIPSSMVGVIVPRSGLGSKYGIVISNLVGVIDSDYRGEVGLSVWNRNHPGDSSVFKIDPLDRICQMMFLPVVQVSFNLVEAVSETLRGQGGFGSTGTNG